MAGAFSRDGFLMTTGNDTAPAAGSPLFYSRPVPLQSDIHGDLRILPGKLGFAAKTNAIPLIVNEFSLALHHFPILFAGPSAVWFRMSHPLVMGQTPSPYQRVAVAADSGNGISAILDLSTHVFVNSDLTINLLRKPVGEWVCLDARTHLSSHGGGLAESALYDEQGLIGRATQSLFVRRR